MQAANAGLCVAAVVRAALGCKGMLHSSADAKCNPTAVLVLASDKCVELSESCRWLSRAWKFHCGRAAEIRNSQLPAIRWYWRVLSWQWRCRAGGYVDAGATCLGARSHDIAARGMSVPKFRPESRCSGQAR